jgi:hypothetical protein
LGLIQFEVRSSPSQGPEHEAQSLFGRADHGEHEAGVSVAGLCRKTGQIPQPGRTQKWIKLGGKVKGDEIKIVNLSLGG